MARGRESTRVLGQVASQGLSLALAPISSITAGIMPSAGKRERAVSLRVVGHGRCLTTSVGLREKGEVGRPTALCLLLRGEASPSVEEVLAV